MLLCVLSHSWDPSIFNVAGVADESVAKLVGSEVEISGEYREVAADARVLNELAELKALHRTMSFMLISLIVLRVKLHPSTTHRNQTLNTMVHYFTRY